MFVLFCSSLTPFCFAHAYNDQAPKGKTAAPKASKDGFDRTALEDLLKRRFFYAPSFSIYGGTSLFRPPSRSPLVHRLHLNRSFLIVAE